jgi:hypothetical protein
MPSRTEDTDEGLPVVFAGSSFKRANLTPGRDWVSRLDAFSDEVKRLLVELEHIQQDVDEANSQIDLELTYATLDAVVRRLQIIADRERGLAAGES